MTNLDIIRAWKDEAFRDSLSAEQRALLPANPAGVIDLTPAQMEATEGGKPIPQSMICTFMPCLLKTVKGYC